MEKSLRALIDAAQGVSSIADTFSLVALVMDTAVDPIVVGTLERWLLVSRCFAQALGYEERELEAIDWKTLVIAPGAVEETEVVLASTGLVTDHVMAYRARGGSVVRVAWRWGAPSADGVTVATGRFI